MGCDAGPGLSGWGRLPQSSGKSQVDQAPVFVGESLLLGYPEAIMPVTTTASEQIQGTEFVVELHPLTMPSLVVSAWVKPASLEETSVQLGFTLSELEC